MQLTQSNAVYKQVICVAADKEALSLIQKIYEK